MVEKLKKIPIMNREEDLMALNLKNEEVERLVEEVSSLAGESKTEAVRRALRERRDRLVFKDGNRRRGERFLRYLEEEIWPNAPEGELGRRLTRDEEDQILGFGEDGA